MGAAGDGDGGRFLPLMDPVLCVDIGGTSTKASVLASNGVLGAITTIPSQPPVEQYFENLLQLLAPAGPMRNIGVSVAGFLDSECNYLVYNPNLAWLEGFPLRTRLQQQFSQANIELEVDSNAATMAEYHFGSGNGSRRFLCATVGTGLGVGMVVDGEPLRFAYGCLGDIGHVIVKRDGPRCACGGRGCAEVMLSAPRVAERYDPRATLRDVIAAAGQDDHRAKDVLHEAGEWLGIAIASIAHALFPDRIAIAGGLSEAGDHVLKPAERVFRESAGVLARSGVVFTKAALGSAAPLMGSAWPFWR